MPQPAAGLDFSHDIGLKTGAGVNSRAPGWGPQTGTQEYSRNIRGISGPRGVARQPKDFSLGAPEAFLCLVERLRS